MCNQTVGLVGAELERRGITTVCLQFYRRVAEAVRPPRSLLVPFPLGVPLGAPDEPERQRAVLRRALSVAADGALEPGAIVAL